MGTIHIWLQRLYFTVVQCSSILCRMECDVLIAFHVLVQQQQQQRSDGPTSRKSLLSFGLLQCTYANCQRTFLSRSALNRHTKEFHKLIRYPCPVEGCCCAPARKSQLRTHLAEKHGHLDVWTVALFVSSVIFSTWWMCGGLRREQFSECLNVAWCVLVVGVAVSGIIFFLWCNDGNVDVIMFVLLCNVMRLHTPCALICDDVLMWVFNS